MRTPEMFDRRRWLALAASAAGVLALAGCAAYPPVADAYARNPDGTAYSYWRTTTGSFGNAEGRVDWRIARQAWQGREVLASVSPQAGTTLYESGTHAVVAQLNPAGQTVVVYDPPLGPRMPMVVGDRYTTSHKVNMPLAGRSLTMEVQWVVEAHERVTVRAGSFDAWRWAGTNSFGEVERIWTNPGQGLGVIRREITRPASHPQGAGTLTGELIAFQRAN